MNPAHIFRTVGGLSGDPIRLTALHCETIVELALHGSGSSLDVDALEDLCRMGLVEVHSATRRTMLTDEGAEIYRQLAGGQ